MPLRLAALLSMSRLPAGALFLGLDVARRADAWRPRCPPRHTWLGTRAPGTWGARRGGAAVSSAELGRRVHEGPGPRLARCSIAGGLRRCGGPQRATARPEHEHMPRHGFAYIDRPCRRSCACRSLLRRLRRRSTDGCHVSDAPPADPRRPADRQMSVCGVAHWSGDDRGAASQVSPSVVARRRRFSGDKPTVREVLFLLVFGGRSQEFA